ncbi:MAG: SPOR domain-containing protein [Bacteroidota bacterium]
MSHLSEHIAALLYHHDCVMIPEFGGFVSNIKGATLDPKKHVVLPPRKVISFNAHLTSNDGLLIQLLAEVDGLSYSDAHELLKAQVVKMHQDLLEGKALEFPGVGVVYRNPAGNTQFSSDDQINFLKSSFGLKSISLTPLTQLVESNTEKATTVVIPLPPKEEAVEKEEKKKKRKFPWVAALAIGIIGAGVLAAGSGLVKKHDQLSILPSFSLSQNHVESDYVPRFEEEDIRLDHPQELNIIDTWEKENPEMGSVYYSFQEDKVSPEGVLIHLNDQLSQKKEGDQPINKTHPSVPVQPNSDLKMYSIVAGAFSEEANANNMVKKLKRQGFDAMRIGKKGRLHLVAYGSYSNRAAAEQALTGIRAEHNKHAWIK